MRKYLAILLILCVWTTIKAQTYVLNGTEATVTNATAGCLETVIPNADWSAFSKLTVSGTINSKDIRLIRDQFNALTILNLGGTTVAQYTGSEGTNAGTYVTYAANVFPIYALKGKGSITSIIFPAAITCIDEYALQATEITSLTKLPSSLLSINESAFDNCNNLTTVELPCNLQEIGVKAFSSNGNLTSVSLPASITTINDDAFNNCGMLHDIYIRSTDPSSITLGSNVFDGNCLTNGVLHIPIGSGASYRNAAYWSGFVYTNEDIPLTVCTYTMSGTKATLTNIHAGFIYAGGIPASDWSTITDLTIIGSIDASDIRIIRDNLINLTTLNLGRTTIDKYTGTEGPIYGRQTTYEANVIPEKAFSQRGGLANVIFPASIIRIDPFAFYESGITSVATLPVSLLSIEEGAFYGCLNLTELILPDLIRSIGVKAFYNNAQLRWVSIPARTEIINDQAFNECNALQYIYMESANPSTISVGTDPFSPGLMGQLVLHIPTYSASNYANATFWKDFPNTRNDYGAIHVFGKTMIIPSSTAGIFATGGTVLEEVKSEITKLIIAGPIDASDFRVIRDDFLSLTTLDLNDARIVSYTGADGTDPGVTSYDANVIPSYALNGRSTLTTVYFPTSYLSAIGKYAFSETGIKSVAGLTPSIVEIREAAFAECPNLTRVTLNFGLESIGAKAFFNDPGLTSIIIPTSVTNIEEQAFNQCTSLVSVFMDSSDPNLGCDPNNTFDPNTLSNGALYVPSGASTDYSSSAWSCFQIITEGVRRPQIDGGGGCGKTSSTFLLIEGYDINDLGDYSPVEYGYVWSEREMPTLELSSSMAIGEINTGPHDIRAEITGLAPSTLYRFRPYATNFAGTTYGEMIEAPTDELASATKVTINGSVATITDATPGFIYRGGISTNDKQIITELIISGSIDATDIRIIRDDFIKLEVLDLTDASIAAYSGNEGTDQSGSFSYGENFFPIYGLKNNNGAPIRQIELPTSLTRIDPEAFSGRDALTGIRIPEGVTRIGYNAFIDCNHLDTLTLPSSLTIIEGHAFQNCSNLSTIKAYPTTPVDLTSSDNIFDGVPGSCLLRVPGGSLTAYSEAEVWRDCFPNIVVGFIPPTVTTQAVSNVTSFTAQGNGNMTSLGDIKPIDCGVLVSTTPNPNVGTAPRRSYGTPTKTGPFAVPLSGLNPGTTYYIRSYALNESSTLDAGIVYGETVFFTTTKAQLTITKDPVVAKKIYDGTDTATLSSIGTLSTITKADSSNLTISTTATYGDFNLGTGKKVTVHYTLGGSAASRYIAPEDKTVYTGEICKGFSLNLLAEGLWNTTSQQMNKCREWDESTIKFVDKFPNDVVDTVSIELFSSSFMNPTHTISGLNLHQDGSVTSDGLSAIAISPSITGSYYVSVKCRNHLPAATSIKHNFDPTNTSYTFRDVTSRAYVSDLVRTPTKELTSGTCALYAGNVLDENDDYLEINIGDLYQVFNNRSGITKQYGYLENDIDGSGEIDLNDVYLLFHNRDAILYIP